jgi:septum formation protein
LGEGPHTGRGEGAAAPLPPLILASRSPQRRAILEQLGIPFSVVVPQVDELMSGPPDEVVLENAHRKASAVAADAPDALVVGVDTVVWAGGRMYGKPADRARAAEALQALSGTRHVVLGGVCLIAHGRSRTAAARTVVEFRHLNQPLIDWYLDSGEWRERAGGYAIQGRGAALVASVDGDYLNVVGLPVATLLELEPGLLTRT